MVKRTFYQKNLCVYECIPYLLKDFWYLFANDGKHGVITLRLDIKWRSLRKV